LTNNILISRDKTQDKQIFLVAFGLNKITIYLKNSCLSIAEIHNLYFFLLEMIMNLQILVEALLFLALPHFNEQYLMLPNGKNLSVVELVYGGTPPGDYVAGPMVPQFPNTNYSGKIVLVPLSLPMEPVWRSIIKHGAVAGITSGLQGIAPGYTQFWTDSSNTDDITIYTGELAYNDWLTANNTLWSYGQIDLTTGLPYINVTIKGWTPNPWDILQSSGFFVWQIILTLINAAALLYMVYKLTIIIIYGQKKKISIAVTICVLEIAGCLLRLVYIALDPLDATRLIPYIWEQILLTIYFPFGVASNLLFLFCWQEILTMKNMKVSPFLSKLLVPFIVVSIILFLLDLAAGVARGLNLPQYSNVISIVEAILYISILMTLAIWTFVIAGRVFKHYNWSKEVFSKKDKIVYKTSVVCTIIGVTYLLLVLLSALSIVKSLYGNPVDYVVVWFFLLFFFTSRGFLQVFVLNVSTKAKTSSMSSYKGSSSDVGHKGSSSALQQKQYIATDIDEVSGKDTAQNGNRNDTQFRNEVLHDNKTTEQSTNLKDDKIGQVPEENQSNPQPTKVDTKVNGDSNNTQ
jgi:hypothetical protein